MIATARRRMLEEAARVLTPRVGLHLYNEHGMRWESLWDGLAAGVACNIELATDGQIRSFDLLRRGAQQ